MIKRLLPPVLALGLGLALLASTPTPAAESAASADKVNKLIEQMASSDFEVREKATAELDAIGAPALEVLKKAMTHEDAEVRRRAEELVKKIEKRSESATVLVPSKIHLVYKDTPLQEGLADFRKKSGYNITVHDPQNKLKDRKVTLDTGATTFWQAFDQFCAKAGLAEAKPEDLVQQVPPPPNPPQPVPLPGPNPQPRPLPVRPGAPAPERTPLEPAKPDAAAAKEQEKAVARATVTGKVVQAVEVEGKPAVALPAQQAQPAQPATKPAVQPAQPPAAQPGQAAAPPAQLVRPGIRPAPQPFVQVQPGQIILVDGKPKELPTDYATAVRVRAMDKADTFGAAGEGQFVLGLQVSPEPKLTWQQLIAVKITKAVDDKDQKLVQGANDVPANPFGAPGGIGIAVPVNRRGGIVGNPFGWGGIHQQVPVHLKKGEKASKSLKELSGTISAEMLSPAKPVITTDDVFKSANKTFKGGDGGSIKILEATKADNGQVRVRFELVAPKDYVPANGGGFNGINNGGGIILPGRGIQIQPILPQGAFQIQIQAQALPAVGGPVQVQIAPGGPAVWNPVGNGFNGGITVVDGKGNTIAATVQQQWVRDNNGVRMENVAVFQLPKGQDVAKLVFSGSRSVSVDIPFTLKNVPLP